MNFQIKSIASGVLGLQTITLAHAQTPSLWEAPPQASKGATPSTQALGLRGDARKIEVRAHDAGVEAVTCSSNSQLIATGSSYQDPKHGTRGEVKIWNADEKLQKTLSGHTSGVKALAFSSDGITLACGQHNGRIVLDKVDEPTGDPATLPNNAKVTALAFAPDASVLISGANNGILTLWK